MDFSKTLIRNRKSKDQAGQRQEISMGLHIDHISLASPHIFRSADTLLKETGLGYWTGEWIGDTSVNIVPLGPPGNFIEISGFVDIFTLDTMNEHKQWILDITE